MKLNLSFHFRLLMCGVILLFSAVLMFYSLFPGDDWLEWLEGDDGELAGIIVFFLLFLAYGVGILTESTYQNVFTSSRTF